MTIPLELKLTATPDGPRLTWTPVKELDALRAKSHSIDPMTLTPDAANPLANIRGGIGRTPGRVRAGRRQRSDVHRARRDGRLRREASRRSW